jgi:hypothetical protein
MLDKMIEVKVSFDSDRQRALEDTRYWGALALSAQEKVGVEDPIAMERLADVLPAERTATRWIVSTHRKSTSNRSGSVRISDSTTWCSTRQDLTSSASWTSTPKESCRCYGK